MLFGLPELLLEVGSRARGSFRGLWCRTKVNRSTHLEVQRTSVSSRQVSNQRQDRGKLGHRIEAVELVMSPP